MVAMEILSRETIKPSSPTPPHLKSYKLSLLDQLSFNMYMPMLYFYPNNKGISESTASKSSILKTSLSETLTLYYPFAGRLTDDMLSIDCNEEGVDFWEARIESPMSEFLKQSNPQDLNLLVPAGIAWNKLADDSSLMVVQLSHFDCGGTALSVCITHKLGDACTMNSFMTDWVSTAAAALRSGKQTPPVFISSCLLPSPNNAPVIVQELEPGQRKCVTKRFFFDASRVAGLRTAIADSSSGFLKKPTRVEVVTALLYKCAMVTGKVISGSFKMSRLIQSVNMRQRVIPPLPNNSIGNFSWYVTISTEDESELNLLGLVGKLRNGIAKLCDQSRNDLEMNEWVTGIWMSMKEVKVVPDDLVVYMCTSFCSYPLHGADYGWGKPMLVRMASGVIKNAFVLMDSEKGDGIEAWVTLEEQDMEVFQRDEELLSFASLS